MFLEETLVPSVQSYLIVAMLVLSYDPLNSSIPPMYHCIIGQMEKDRLEGGAAGREI